MLLIRHGESEFNVHYGKTRIDPGIEDPRLTENGIAQVEAAARRLAREPVTRIITSPYTRALHTAQIIADVIDVPVEVETLVRERYHFACDIGTLRDELAAQWSHLDFAHLTDRWWPEVSEPESSIDQRAVDFHTARASLDDVATTLVVSHWGFIRALTGERVGNAQILRINPANPREVVAFLDP
ncbi:MAG: histidine phosphatase family protein [Rhodospirillales bacterium]